MGKCAYVTSLPSTCMSTTRVANLCALKGRGQDRTEPCSSPVQPYALLHSLLFKMPHGVAHLTGLGACHSPDDFFALNVHPEHDHNLSINHTHQLSGLYLPSYSCTGLQCALCRSSNLLLGLRSLAAPNQPPRRASQPLQLYRRHGWPLEWPG